MGTSAFFQERNDSTDKNKPLQKLAVFTFQPKAWCLQEQWFNSSALGSMTDLGSKYNF